MPNITLNGTAHTTPAESPAMLLKQLGLGNKQAAIEINGQIIPRSAHATTALQEGDKVEVIHFVGGG